MKMHVVRWIARFMLMLLIVSTASADIQQVGAVTDIQVVTDSETGQKKAVCSLSSGGTLEVIPYAPDTFRVRFHWVGLYEIDEIAIAKPLSDWPFFTAEFIDQGNTFTIETPEVVAEIVRTPTFQIHFKDADGYYLLRDDRTEFNTDYHPIDDGSYWDIYPNQELPRGFKLKAVKEMPGNEAYFGFGEYPGPLNRRGETIQGWNTDTFAWGEFQNPMYMTLPFFYGVQGWTEDHPPFAYGIFFNNPARPTFKMGTEWGDKYSFEAGDGQLDYFFFGGGEDHTMKKVLSRYSELTGAAYMLPKWALGFHQSRHSYRNQGWVEWLADEFRNQDIPCDAIYLDIGTQDSTGQQHQLTFNTNFTDVAGMISYCENKGINLIPLIEPCLTLEDPMYGEAEAELHFAKDRNLNTYVGENFLGSVSWLDFSSSATRDWWKGKLVDYLDDYPFPAIWNDLNEPNEANMPLDLLWYMDGRFGGGSETEDTRKWNQNVKNTFCVRECEVTHQALREKSPEKRPFVLSRAGWPGIQRYATGWSGDNVASYDHLRHNIPLGVSVMISGQANFGHDIGGFMGDSWGDLLTRWTQWGSLNPVFRNHNIDTTSAQEPWVFGSPYTEYIRDAIKFRYKLMPYIYTLAHESTVSGIPMNTPTVFHFMYDTETHYQNDYDFMVGDYLLAAPVYEGNASDRWVYLPSGVEWYNWQDDAKSTGGGWVNVSAPQGTLPLFVRSGAIIPMGPAMSHVNEYQPEYIDLHVWPADYSEFTLYEDDGESMAYLGGDYAETRIVSDLDGSTWTFTINQREGSYDPGRDSVIVMAHAVNPVNSVTKNGEVLPVYDSLFAMHQQIEGWFYDLSERKLYVKIPDAAEGTELAVEIDDGLLVEWVGNTYTYPFQGDIRATDELWINTESYPQGAGTNAAVVYSSDGGEMWSAADLEFAGQHDANDWWHANLGKFAAGTVVEYAVAVIDDDGRYSWDSNNGNNYTVSVITAQPVLWQGNTHYWPWAGEIDPGEDFWVNIESFPIGSAAGAKVAYTADGVNWQTVDMSLSGQDGNNDWWHVNLGQFPSGTHIQFAVVVQDGNGTDYWDSNDGADYHADVN